MTDEAAQFNIINTSVCLSARNFKPNVQKRYTIANNITIK